MVSYAAIVASWIIAVGIPAHFLLIAVCAWGASIAWNIDQPVRHHLKFWRDWWIPLALLGVYSYSRGIADQLWNTVAVQTPITLDTWLGGGELPTTRLQALLCEGTCDPLDAQWFDYLFSLAYVSHFFVAMSIAGFLYIKNRDSWVQWMRRYMLLCALSLIVFIAYPMAPPWLAKDLGAIDDPIVRLTSRGWESFGVNISSLLVSPSANAVAAMPSLHAAVALLVAVWGVRRIRTPLRWGLAVYPAVMALTLVFYADHYVIDVIAGFALVGFVEVVCLTWDRKRVSSTVPAWSRSRVVPPTAEASPGRDRSEGAYDAVDVSAEDARREFSDEHLDPV